MHTLKEPAAEAQLHSKQLSEHLRRYIAEHNGWIGFDQFMQQALYAPGLGYYSAEVPKFGADGDFITAPLMGDVTARCLAKQCVEVLAEIGRGDILEFGAGTGQLAADILLEMEALGQLPTRYLVVETSAQLKARQRETITTLCPALCERVEWLEQLPTRSDDTRSDGNQFNGIIIANEVLDAMPSLRFEMDANGQALALGVSMDENDTEHEFRWSLSTEPLPKPLQARLADYALESGYQSEIGLRGEAWVRSLGDILDRGVVLLIDYGFPRREFYHAERRGGTLMCHYQHVAHDNPFFYPGLQDISVHIDFTAIAQAAQDAELQLAGYTTQGAFLLSLGALNLLAEQQTQTSDKNLSLLLSKQIQTLTMPYEMGELFKVIAFSRNYEQPLSGFSMKDRSNSLV